MTALAPAAIDADVPTGVLELLRGNRTGHASAGSYGSFVTGFFGPNIRLHDEDDEPGDTPMPYLGVLWASAPERGQFGDLVQGTSRVTLEVRLPRQAQRLASIAVPAAPSVSAVSGGTAIAAGVYTVGYTAYTTAGESYGGPVSTVTVGTGQMIHFASIPSNVRIWRSSVGRLDVRYLDLPTATTYDDDHADTSLGDALFPEQGLARNVVASVCRVLSAAQFVPDAIGQPLTDATLVLGAVAISTDRVRNVKRLRWTAEWSNQFSAYTREAE